MRFGGTLLALVAVFSASRPASADDGCVDGYTQAQVLRRTGKLRAAKKALVSCSQETCSSAIRIDCFKWAEEIERALSTVLFDVRLADGSEVTAVKVYVDEELVASTLDGRQTSLDPGEVTLRFVYESQSMEKRAVIREGEKFRTIRIEFPAKAAIGPAAPPAAARQPAPVPHAEPPSFARPVPALSWVLGGISVTGFVTFGVLAGTGFAKERELRNGCFVTDSCSGSDVSSVRTQYLVADIALGVGLVGLAAAAVYWLVRPPAPTAAVTAGSGR